VYAGEQTGVTAKVNIASPVRVTTGSGRGSEMASISCCWICGKPIRLEDCKIDEHGMPVHEACYVAKLLRKKVSRPTDVTPPTETVS